MLRRTSAGVAWLVAALVVALGAAGLVAALDHLPGGIGRPELTWTADRAVADDLDAVSAELLALADTVGVLGGYGRSSLAALVGRDAAGLAAALDAGTAQLDAVDAAAARMAASLAAISLAGADRAIRHSPATLARYDAAAAALAAVDPLRPAWERLTAGVVPATELTGHLLAHDEIAATAIQSGGAGKYAQAIARIDKATAELAAARTIRDRLAATVDVATLDEWIDRNGAYDKALRDLWDALRRSKGRVTAAVRDAAARERAARQVLPPDARALVVILGDVARGGLNQAVIVIEEARGQLLDAGVRAGASPPP
ncbi:MAG TPA: hypothetical protein VER83_01505 [Candidatus Nanopelagicales bacterium]|nr:hypothetical protein [Candidatus Nanopelagicales bacterium]